MVRGDSGRLFDEFRERNAVALGWHELADVARPGVSREEIAKVYAQRRPEYKKGSILSGSSQVWRFVNEVKTGDKVVTYSPSLRKYLVGTIKGPLVVDAKPAQPGMSLCRSTEWIGEVDRDRLGLATRNSLGSTLTFFQIPASAASEITAALGATADRGGFDGVPALETVAGAAELEEESREQLQDLEARSFELIKDRVTALDWDELQELIAGLLRAMGYKTRVASPGPDRGADIVASPDGLGFENPRIVVEVKHRSGAMGSKEVRSFLGGRHKDDRGLYVSTGGFTKDARYEADRAGIPLALWELDDIVRGIVDYYDKLDSEARQLVPLKRIYWPT